MFSTGFDSPETEKAFLRQHHDAKGIRVALLCGILMYLSYLLVDFFLFPSYFAIFLFIRIVVFLPLAAILYALTFSKDYYGFSTPLLVAFPLLGGLGIILMMYMARTSPYISFYFYGITQVLMFLFGIGKVPVLPASVTGFVLVAATIAVDATFLEEDPLMAVAKGVFLVTIAAIGTISATILEQSTRSNFANQLRIGELSITDALTGLRNRCYFNQTIEAELSDYIAKPPASSHPRLERAEDLSPDRRHCLCLLDIDHFKAVNDNYGHDVGDLVLREFGQRLSRAIRASDALIRWGGEEFLLLLRNADAEFPRRFSRILKREISGTPFAIGGGRAISVTVSGGFLLVAPHREVGGSGTAIALRLVDEALYRSKRDGRNRFTQVFPSALAESCEKGFETIPD